MSGTDLLRILCVDDEVNVLSGLERTLRKAFPVVTALGGEAALDVLRKDRDFALIISDMRMPGMDGATFLSSARLLVPNAARVLLTGQADLEAVIKAINGGSIHYYLKKPTEKEELLRVVHTGFATHRENVAHGNSLRNLVNGAMEMMCQILDHEAPATSQRAQRVRQIALSLWDGLGFQDEITIGVAAPMACLAERRELKARTSAVEVFLNTDEALQGAQMALREIWNESAEPSAAAKVIVAAMRIDEVAQAEMTEETRFEALSRDLEPKVFAIWKDLLRSKEK